MNTENANIRPLVTIEKNNRYFDDIKWTCKALSKDATRHVTTFLWCEVDDAGETILVAIDGRRLHTAKIDTDFLGGLTPGAYVPKIAGREILLVPATEEINFPNWKQTIPASFAPTRILEGSVMVDKQNTLSRFVATLNRQTNLKDGEFVSFADEFLSDLLGLGTLYGAKGKMTWHYKAEFSSPCIIESGNKLGVLMPMRS